MIRTGQGLAVCLVGLLAAGCPPTGDDDDGGGASSSSSSSGAVSASSTSRGGTSTGTSQGSTSARDSSGVSGASSSGPCQSPLECPGEDTACRTRTCEGGTCGFSNTAANVHVGSQVPGDCHVLVCDGLGEVMAQVDDTDTPDDHSDCTDDRCLNGEALHEMLAPGTLCSSNGGVFCSDDGLCIQCQTAGDCSSTVCRDHRCVDATCGDRVKNGEETDQDCGGPSCFPCGPYLHCQESRDCRGGSCVGQVCVPTCTDSATDGNETDVDCGGPDCPRCGVGLGCLLGVDCASAVCGTGRLCAAPACGDGLINGQESCDDGNRITEACPYGLTQCTVCGAACTRVAGVTAYCGDGSVNGPETCDDGNTVTETCAYGVTSCQVCAADCTSAYGAVAYCGDGALNGSEECDEGTANTNTCPYGAGPCTVCSLNCLRVSGTPQFCGDGALNGSEECDDGNTVTEECAYATARCTVCDATCHRADGGLQRCGDGVVNGPETCDDGNTVTEACDYGLTRCAVCDVTCHSVDGGVWYCGDGVVNGPENCDDHNAVTETCAYGLTRCAVCDSTCHTADGGVAYCGDKVKNGPEECDDGNTSTPSCTYGQRDGGCRVCDPACHLQDGVLAFCGNGRVDAPQETCDDGNTVTETCSYGLEQCSVCTATCQSVAGATSYCGDNRLDPTHEACDDGNQVDGDCCSSACQPEGNCEVEPNDTAADAVASGGSFPQSGVIKGKITTVGDVDFLPILVTQVIDLTVESFEGRTPGQCPTADTFLELRAADGITVLASDDEDGPNSCSRIDPALGDVGAAALLPGSYFLVVREYGDNAAIPLWGLTLTPTAVCGNGALEGSEQCDDHNLVSGDGCSNRCRLELDPETEPNNTCAQANGPFPLPWPHLLYGAISPATDVDWWTFTLATAADVRIGSFDANGPSNCASIDTTLQLYAADCSTALGPVRDDTATSLCAALDPATHAEVRHLMPGSYRVQVASGSGLVIPAYTLWLTLSAVCGNGVKEGYEQCDGTAHCDANCNRLPWCGDGFVDGPEQCDDSNTDNGDGCSASCQWEVGRWCGDGVKITSEACDDGNLAVGDGCDATCQVETVFDEVEENPWWDGWLNSQTAFTSTPSSVARGSINHSLFNDAVNYPPNTDQDFYKVTVQTPGVVRFEVFDGSGADCTSTANPFLELYSGAGALMTTRSALDDQGIGTCPAYVFNLAAGSYYSAVSTSTHSGGADPTRVMPAYRYQVKAVPSLGNEVEPNNTLATANVLAGLEMSIWGGHQDPADVDVYAVDLPPGRSLRAEIIEGGTKTCESRAMDTYLEVLNSAGTVLVAMDDLGRGYCSLVDGTGSVPQTAAAHALAEGRYYLRVSAAPFAAGGDSAKFDYRLAVTIR